MQWEIDSVNLFLYSLYRLLEMQCLCCRRLVLLTAVDKHQDADEDSFKRYGERERVLVQMEAEPSREPEHVKDD